MKKLPLTLLIAFAFVGFAGGVFTGLKWNMVTTQPEQPPQSTYPPEEYWHKNVDAMTWVPLAVTPESCTPSPAPCTGKSLKTANLSDNITIDAMLTALGTGDNAPTIDLVITDTDKNTTKVTIPDLYYTTMSGGTPEFTAAATHDPSVNTTYVQLSVKTGEFETNKYIFSCVTGTETCTEIYKTLQMGDF